MDINLTTLFEDFYHTRFFVCICLSMFTFLFSLRLDEVIKCSYWIIFAPLWIWKLTALVGIVVGTVFWIRLSHRRFERDTFIQFKSMLITFLTLTILFLFELITCDKLDGGRSQPSWSVCFVPLFILSVLSIAICIWSIRYDRSYEIELICSLNILQFVFIALRLDNTITWSWILVLVPVWIIMSIAMIVLLYIIILTIVMRKTNQSLAHHHNHHKPKHRWTNCILYVLFIFSLLTFEILLTNKLDQEMMPGMGASSSSGSSNPSALSPSLLSLGVIGPPAQSAAAAASQPSSSSSNSVNIIAHLPNIPNIISINMPPPTSRDSQPQQQQPQPSAPSNFLFSNSQSLQQNYYGPSNKSSAIHRSPLPTSASISASSSSSSTHLNLSYFQVSLPLYLVYLSLILLSLNNHSGNTMWFGMRRDFCDYFLVVCPVFKTYGNVQIKWSFHGDNSNNSDQLMNSNGNGGTNGETGRNRASNATSRHSNTNRSQPSRLNRSNETSLMTFNLAPNSANQSNRGAANNNPSTHNCISLSLLEAGNQPPSNQHPQSMTSADDNESALVIEVDSVSIANPLMASQQQQQPPISKSSKKQSKSKRKQQQRDQQQQQQQTSSSRFNRQFSIPSYISNAYSDRTSLKSFYLINNQTTVNSSILNGAGSSAFAIKKSNKVGKIIQLDVPD